MVIPRVPDPRYRWSVKCAAAIVIVLGTTSCRQILGIDPGSVRGDAGGGDAGDAMLDDDGDVPTIDAMIDAPPVVWTNVAVVPGFSAGDQDPTLTSDMLELYFTRGTDIYFSTRPTATSAWNTPMEAGYTTPVGSFEQSPELTGDGLVLQFTSDRGTGTDLDVYYVARLNRASAWGQPTELASVNRGAFDERPGSATTDGKYLTLSSDRNGNGTSVDLYEAFRPGALGTAYDPPVRIPLSTNGEDGSPFLTNDGLTLYYASAPVGSAIRDLFVATRPSPSVPFSAGTRIDELCTTANDSDPWVSPDGREIYFVSDRDGLTRIWHASRP